MCFVCFGQAARTELAQLHRYHVQTTGPQTKSADSLKQHIAELEERKTEHVAAARYGQAQKLKDQIDAVEVELRELLRLEEEVHDIFVPPVITVATIATVTERGT